MKAGIIDEIMEDAMDSALDSEDMEDETDAEVDKVCVVFEPLLRQTLLCSLGKAQHTVQHLCPDSVELCMASQAVCICTSHAGSAVLPGR